MWRHLPNALCVLRIVLIVPIAALLLQARPQPALWVFAAAALTDVLDGFLAKRYGWQTELGKRLDPLADKLLLVTVFVVVAVLGQVPLWLAAAVVLRDLTITAGGLCYLWLYGDPQGRPTVVSKLNTFLQVAFVLGVVGQQAIAAAANSPSGAAFGGGWSAALLPGHPALTVALSTLGACVFVTTVVSGLDYVLRYSVKARAAHHARRAVPAV